MRRVSRQLTTSQNVAACGCHSMYTIRSALVRRCRLLLLNGQNFTSRAMVTCKTVPLTIVLSVTFCFSAAYLETFMLIFPHALDSTCQVCGIK